MANNSLLKLSPEQHRDIRRVLLAYLFLNYTVWDKKDLAKEENMALEKAIKTIKKCLTENSSHILKIALTNLSFSQQVLFGFEQARKHIVKNEEGMNALLSYLVSSKGDSAPLRNMVIYELSLTIRHPKKQNGESDVNWPLLFDVLGSYTYWELSFHDPHFYPLNLKSYGHSDSMFGNSSIKSWKNLCHKHKIPTEPSKGFATDEISNLLIFPTFD